MNHSIRSLIGGALLVTFSSQASAEWEPTFVDNFDGTELDLESWVPDLGILQRRINYYDKDALSVQDGKLVIGVLNRAEADRAYTTGAVSTQGTFKQRYGYFEIRAKIPKGDGFWPAFWLMPESGTWSSEIDIAEFRGHLPNTVHHAFHYGNQLHNENGFTAQAPIDLSQSFNNFAVNWTAERIDYLINGNVVHSVTDPAAVANASSDMFVILNLALASKHSGWVTTVRPDTDLTQAFEVEYVRVYQDVPGGRYATIPAAEEPVADVRSQPYDNTALAVNRVDPPAQGDIFRTPNQITGAIEVRAHKDDYFGRVSVVLTSMSAFNLWDGGFAKSPSIEEQVFYVTLPAAGDSQVIEYTLATPPAPPQVYSVDIVIRDVTTQSKKSLAGHRVIQAVDNAQPGSTVWLDGFFRAGQAAYASGAVNATLPLQLQQALLTPYLDVSYKVVDTASGEVLATQEARLEHADAGLQTLTPALTLTLDPARSAALVASVRDSSGTSVIPEYSVQIVSAAQP